MKYGMTSCLAGASLALFAGLSPAHAIFVVDPLPAETNLFLNNGSDVSSFSGTVGSDVVNITTVGNVDTAAGNATIKPIKQGTLTILTFTPVNGSLFDSFSFRGQLLEAGTVTVTVQDNQRDAAQTFNFNVAHANQDFPRLGIIAAIGSGETIRSVSISDSGGFKEAKQFEFDVAGAVPELSTWGMMLIGFAGVGLQMRRRARHSALTATT